MISDQLESKRNPGDLQNARLHREMLLGLSRLMLVLQLQGDTPTFLLMDISCWLHRCHNCFPGFIKAIGVEVKIGKKSYAPLLDEYSHGAAGRCGADPFL